MEKPIYVQAHVRNKRIHKPEDGSAPALVIVGAVIVMVLIVNWKLTASVATIVSLAVFVKKYYQFVNDPGRLVVNHYGMSGAANVWNNINEMVRG